LALQTNGNTAVTIDATGNMGVGTSSPGSGVRLDVLGGEIRAGRVDTSSEGGQVSFSRSTDNATAWYLDVYGNTSTPSFRVVDVGAGAVSLTVNSSGAVALRGGVSASGVGITFPSTQVASSDANTLDDYEEGTWSPSILGFTSPTYGTRKGTYTKIGRQVNFALELSINGGTRNADGVQITLPITSASSADFRSFGAYWTYVDGSILASTTTNLPTIFIPNNASHMQLYGSNGGSFTGNDLGNATPTFYICGSFITN
jgi:hypothetical protein